MRWARSAPMRTRSLASQELLSNVAIGGAYSDTDVLYYTLPAFEPPVRRRVAGMLGVQGCWRNEPRAFCAWLRQLWSVDDDGTYGEHRDYGFVRSEERRVGKECRSRW